MATVSAVVHVRPNPKDLCDPIPIHRRPFGQQERKSLEFREIALLLCRKEAKMIEKRDYVFPQGREVVDLVVPDSVVPLAHRPTSEVPFELREDYLITLGDVEAQGNFPRCPIVAPRPERDVETALAVREAGQVVPNVARHRPGV